MEHHIHHMHPGNYFNNNYCLLIIVHKTNLLLRQLHDNLILFHIPVARTRSQILLLLVPNSSLCAWLASLLNILRPEQHGMEDYSVVFNFTYLLIQLVAFDHISQVL